MTRISDALAAMDKATPGPWAVDGRYYTEVMRKDIVVAESWIINTIDETRANTILIAAAPDALAIIKRMLPYIENTRAEVKSVVEMGFFHSKYLDAQLADLNDIIGQIKGDDALIARAKPEEVGR